MLPFHIMTQDECTIQKAFWGIFRPYKEPGLPIINAMVNRCWHQSSFPKLADYSLYRQLPIKGLK